MELKQFNNVKLNLEILGEEAGEVIELIMVELGRNLSRVIRIKSKVVRFGLDDYHPKNGAVNRASLAEEIGHFKALVEILEANETIDAAAVEQGRRDKLDKLPDWYTFFLQSP